MKNDFSKKSVYRKFDDENSVSIGILPLGNKKLRMRKALFLLLYAAFVGVWAVLLVVFQTYVVYVGTFSLPSLLTLVFFTWRYASVEYEISLHDGVFCFAVIYGGLTRKDLFTCPVREFTQIGPYTPQTEGECHADRVLSAVSGNAAEPVFFALYRSPDGKSTLLLFDTCEKLRRRLKYYAPAAFLS